MSIENFMLSNIPDTVNKHKMAMAGSCLIAYLVKLMTKGGGVKNLKKLMTSFMNGPICIFEFGTLIEMSRNLES